jgi:phosphoglycolate phosphatase
MPESGKLAPRHFDLIVFDWDGTLFDSTTLIARCIQAACADLGLPTPSDHDASYVIGMGLPEALQHAAPTLARERYRELALRYRHHYLSRQHELLLFDGVVALLSLLKRRHHLLAIATGKSRPGLDDALATARMQGLFDATRTADETASKPNPKMLHELMDELGVDPPRTLMIGDTTHDLQLAANAGAASVAVSYGAHATAALAEFAPRHLAHSVADLERWLLEHA